MRPLNAFGYSSHTTVKNEVNDRVYAATAPKFPRHGPFTMAPAGHPEDWDGPPRRSVGLYHGIFYTRYLNISERLNRHQKVLFRNDDAVYHDSMLLQEKNLT